MASQSDGERDGLRVRFRSAGPRTALVVGVLTLLMFAACVPLAKVSKTGNPPVLVLPFAVLGFVLARRQPRNPIGWIMLLLGPVFIVSSAAGMYSVLAYRVDGHDLPLSRLAVVLAPAWVLLQVVLPLPILLFPDGRIVARWWRRALWVFLAIAALWIGTLAVLDPLRSANIRCVSTRRGSRSIWTAPRTA